MTPPTSGGSLPRKGITEGAYWLFQLRRATVYSSQAKMLQCRGNALIGIRSAAIHTFRPFVRCGKIAAIRDKSADSTAATKAILASLTANSGICKPKTELPLE
jgi:hypothetical protein